MSLKGIIKRLASPFSPARPASTAASPERGPLAELLDRVYAEAILPNADALAQIFVDRDVALVFFEIGGPDPATDQMVKEGARLMGWGGSRVEVGRLRQVQAAAMAEGIASTNPGDAAGIAWFRRHSEGRLFVLVQAATFCFDFEPGRGFSLAPGTTDAEWKQ